MQISQEAVWSSFDIASTSVVFTWQGAGVNITAGLGAESDTDADLLSALSH
jgi:hypothetical protein